MQIITRSSGIKFKEVRLVGEGDTKIVSFDYALNLAEDMDLDLVLVSDSVTPPVVKIQDNKKVEYKKKKAKAKQGRTSELKEVQLKVNISDHDLGTKINAMERFLKRGDKVKVTIRLKGRERENPERADALLERVIEKVPSKVSRLKGPVTMAILEPLKEKEKEKPKKGEASASPAPGSSASNEESAAKS